jgi:hypothetical protein
MLIQALVGERRIGRRSLATRTAPNAGELVTP